MEKEEPSGLADESSETSELPIPQYKVILHNDDVTPMDFVVMVLMRFFRLDDPRARTLMLEAHKDGSAVVAVMPLERAEFKVSQAHEYARAHSYPLTFSIEPVD